MKSIKNILVIVIAVSSLHAQKNVGVGVDIPQSRLHIHQENLLEDPPSALLLTNSSAGSTMTDGLRLAIMGNNTSINNRENGKLSLGTQSMDVLNILGDGRIGINGESIIGASDMTIHSKNLSGFGGMYLNVNNGMNGRPFYGYAVNGTPSSWTYYDAATTNWIVYIGGDRLVVKNSGAVGIGAINPGQKLDVNGRIKIGTEISADTEGSIQFKDGDFSGFTSEGNWKSFTKIDPSEAMSYDHVIPFSDCTNSPFYLNSSLNSNSTNNSCGTIYDSGGPTSNYSDNEDYTFYINHGFNNTIKIIIDELTIEDENDALVIGVLYGNSLILNESITEPDTFILEPSYYTSVSFFSDGNVNKPGFKLRWEFLDELAPSQSQFTGFYKIKIRGQ